MGQKSTIEWTDATWNPIRGCSRVSEGCRNCYAEKVAYRFSGAGKPYEGLVRINSKGERVAEWNGQVQLVEKHLLDPLKWKEPRRIFVNSMSDLFHGNVPDEWIDRIFAVMALAPQHTFQILTKRPERMLKYLSEETKASDLMDEQIDLADWTMYPKKITKPVDQALKKVGTKENCGYSPLTGKDSYTWMPKIDAWPLPNVWLGVSVEHQKAADERIPLLLQTPAAVRFISAEPLLGPVNLEELPSASGIGRHLDALSNAGVDPGALVPHRLDWVIAGGESGPGARPMHPDWARSLRDQCVTAKVPFFFKQWGEWGPTGPIGAGQLSVCELDGWHGPCTQESLLAHMDDAHSGQAACPPFQLMYRTGKHAAGALLDEREWRQFPVSSEVLCETAV